MPGIHPTSRRQVRFAFAAEARGEMPEGTGREWAHRWKCWSAARKGKRTPPSCARVMRILNSLK